MVPIEISYSTLMGRKAKAAAAAAAAIAGTESAFGRHLSSPGSSTVRKRLRDSSENLPTHFSIPGSSTLWKRLLDSSENPPTPAGSIRHIDPSLAKEILVLFETPSGFAIFSLKYDLNQPDVMKKIWAIFVKDYRSRKHVCLEEFQKFKDKSSAFNRGTAANKELAEMILRHHRPGQALAVGKPEYKRFIETSLQDVPCLFNETVMEVMWGLENLMHSLVPQEEVKLTKEDRLPICQGIKIFLNHHGFDVKPEMVNEKVLVTACILVDAELIEDTNTKTLRWAAGKLKDVSGINTNDWTNVKIVKALKIIFEPILTTLAEIEMFAPKELETLLRDEDKYDDLIIQDTILNIDLELAQASQLKKNAMRNLATLLS
nr:uncharacterized protein LOC127295810 isoform X3 [Lolium perenne]